MKVGIYSRVSTQEQAREGYSIGEQVERLKNYCAAKGWILYKTYTDAGFSGANTDNIPIIARPKGVDVSKFSVIDAKLTLFFINTSSIKKSVSFCERLRRSNL